jgi:hypothetical protein
LTECGDLSEAEAEETEVAAVAVKTAVVVEAIETAAVTIMTAAAVTAMIEAAVAMTVNTVAVT